MQLVPTPSVVRPETICDSEVGAVYVRKIEIRRLVVHLLPETKTAVRTPLRADKVRAVNVLRREKRILRRVNGEALPEINVLSTAVRHGTI